GGRAGRRGNAIRHLLVPALALAALLLGAVDAGARSTDTHTVTVEVIGKGTIKSSPSGLNCGAGNAKCYSGFSDSGSVTLTAKADGGWTFAGWSGACSGTDPTDCDTGSSGDSVVTATFNPKSGTS